MKHQVTKEKLALIQILLEQGFTYQQIEQRTGIPKSIIHRWISIFAENSAKEDKTTVKPQRVIGKIAPEEASTGSISESVEEKIARLERELENERLKTELYKEIISVAEKKYNISIVKKAGTKQ